MTQVSVHDLSIGFGTVAVLRNLSLEVESGEFVVLLGPSGCGKSTLLNAIAGLADVDSGQIRIGGRDVTHAEPATRGIGMVFQSYALYPRMTVEGNLSFGLRMNGVPRDEIRRRVDRAAALLQLGPLMKRYPSALSGGQRQRVAIGRALVRNAEVFLFDEPLSNLDAKLRTELRTEIKRLHRDLGSTMIFVTHDQVEALTLADRIAVMDGGIIQQFGSPRDLYRRPLNRFVAEFLGSPALNVIEGRIEGGPAAPVFVSSSIRLPLDATPLERAPAEGAPVTLGLRPEHIRLGNGDASQGLTCVVDLVEPLGHDAVVRGSVAGASLSFRTGPDLGIRPGDVVPIHIEVENALLFGADGIRLQGMQRFR
jgi:multiple sugar transport system ATP-binding protein